MPSPPGGGQGSAPPEVSPAAETPGLEATPAGLAGLLLAEARLS